MSNPLGWAMDRLHDAMTTDEPKMPPIKPVPARGVTRVKMLARVQMAKKKK